MSKRTQLLIALSFIALPLVSQADNHGSRDFKECAAVRMKEIALKHITSNDDKYFTQVPEGWTVVGGAGGEGHPKMLLCR